jgi:hypothetical protein
VFSCHDKITVHCNIYGETNWAVFNFMHLQLLALLADSLVEAQEQRGATTLDNVSSVVELNVGVLLLVPMSILS